MIPLVYFVIPSDEILDERDPAVSLASSQSSQVTRGPRFDWLGTLLGVSGLVLINFSWNQSPIIGWPTPYIYILLIVGILLVCAFLFVEGRVQSALVPTTIWNRQISLMLVCM
jgi:hypothetical protein